MENGRTTELLLEAQRGDESARDELVSRLYEELRRSARAQLKRHAGRPLQTTELVHEAYLKLCKTGQLSARSRSHFLALASKVMRHILVDHFRSRNAQKRGGPVPVLSLDDGLIPTPERGDLLLAVDDALERLSQLSPHAGRVVEYRFFGGMTEKEIAEVLEVSPRTVSSEWRRARAWLSQELRSP